MRRWIIAAAVLGPTLFNGATEHGSAFVLRLFAVVACLIAWSRRSGSIAADALVAPALSVAVVALGALLAPNGGLAIQSLVSALLVTLLFATTVASRDDLPSEILFGAGIAALAHVGLAIVDLLLGAARGRGGFFNPNDLAAFLAPLCVLAIGAANTHRRWWPVAALLALGVVCSGSRSGLLAITIGAALALKSGDTSRISTVRVIFISLVAATLLVVLTPALRDRVLGVGDAFAFSRLAIWRAALEVALAHPFGVGLNFAEEALRQHGVALDGLVRYPKIAHDAHSELLNAFLELGWAGLLAVLAPVVALLAAIRRTAPDTAPAWLQPRVSLGVLAAFAIPALVSASLHVPIVALLAAAWAAAVVRAAPQVGASTRAASWVIKYSRTLELPVGRAATAIGLAALAIPLVLALPGALAEMLGSRAEKYASNDLRAEKLAAQAQSLAPWSQRATLRLARLELAGTTPPLEVYARLIHAAERFWYSPQPLVHAAHILERLAEPERRTVEQWRTLADVYEEAARRDPRNAVLWTTVGIARRAAGDASPSRTAFERALAEEPSCTRALVFLAEEARQNGQVEVAKGLASRARLASEQASSADGRAAEILSMDPSSETLLAKVLEAQL